MKILVTGGAGFIGSHTVVALSEAGYEPVILDNFSNSDKSSLLGMAQILGKKVKCYNKNCLDKKVLKHILSDEKIEGVIHFAAYKAVGESVKNPLDYYENNVASLVTLLQTIIEVGIENIIFSSSATVYGLTEEMPVTELTPIQAATSPYGNTKQIGEEILKDVFASGAKIKTAALRYFNPIGAHASGLIGELPLGVPNNLIPFVTQTAAGIRSHLTVFGSDYPTPDGTCLRDYIHVVDLAQAHVLALNFLFGVKEYSFYDVFNIGTGNAHSVKTVIDTFERVTKKKIAHTMGERRAGDIPALWADVTKANAILGWKAKRDLEECLMDAWRWQVYLGKEIYKSSFLICK